MHRHTLHVQTTEGASKAELSCCPDSSRASGHGRIVADDVHGDLGTWHGVKKVDGLLPPKTSKASGGSEKCYDSLPGGYLYGCYY